ncbi:threonine synthase [Cladochytrium tenue]|nr:threonine synthase [Cladochytrium tenue]
MLYRSTRDVSSDGAAPATAATFEDAVMRGLAPDGGLYVPAALPAGLWEDVRALAPSASFVDVAHIVFRAFVPAAAAEGGIPDPDLRSLLERSFASFSHPDVTPVVPLPRAAPAATATGSAAPPQLNILELFHGPTFAFKDVALQVLGNLFEYFLERRRARSGNAADGEITVLGATSGDTGGAAIYGLRGRRGVRVFILHPRGRVSPVQERQMTSVLDANVHNVAVDGATFDDCQEIVKALFNDAEFRANHHLAAINSINWARILAQITYYFQAARLLDATAPRSLRFCVPTGNFGDVLAGFYARRLGLPVEALVVATNENDILHRFLESGEYTKPGVSLDAAGAAGAAAAVAGSADGGVRMTLSPAMDILVSSNFERAVWHLAADEVSAEGGGAAAAATAATAAGRVRSWMASLATDGGFRVAPAFLARARAAFASARVSDEQTVDAIARYFRAGGYVLDPHTAVGVVAAEQQQQALPTDAAVVVVGTASPGKFPEAVWRAVPREQLAYERFAPRALVVLDGLPLRATVVEVRGESRAERRDSGIAGVRAVIERTV